MPDAPLSLDVRCQPGRCSLALMGAGGALGSWHLATLAPGVVLNTPAATVFVDKVVPLPTYASALYRPTLRVRAMRACARLLPVLTETISVPASAWAVLRAVGDLRRRPVRPPTNANSGVTRFLCVFGPIILAEHVRRKRQLARHERRPRNHNLRIAAP